MTEKKRITIRIDADDGPVYREIGGKQTPPLPEDESAVDAVYRLMERYGVSGADVLLDQKPGGFQTW